MTKHGLSWAVAVMLAGCATAPSPVWSIEGLGHGRYRLTLDERGDPDVLRDKVQHRAIQLCVEHGSSQPPAVDFDAPGEANPTMAERARAQQDINHPDWQNARANETVAPPRSTLTATIACATEIGQNTPGAIP